MPFTQVILFVTRAEDTAHVHRATARRAKEYTVVPAGHCNVRQTYESGGYD